MFILAVIYGVTAHGGFDAGPQRVLLAGVGLAAALAWWPARTTPRWWVPLALAAPLAVWSVVAAAVDGDVGGAAPVLAILFGVVTAGVVGWAAGEYRDQLVDALLLIGAVVGLVGWVGVAWRIDPLGQVEVGVWRAASTLTYENATAALLAPLAVVALARAIARPARVADRLVAVALLVGVGATMSRAGWLGLAVGVVVVAACVGLRRFLVVAVPVLAGAAVATAGVVAVSPANEHRSALVAVVALVVGAGLVVVRMSGRGGRLVLGVICCGVVVAAVAAFAGPGAHAVRSSRLSVSSADRDHEWAATARVARQHLVTGVGPSHLVIEWRDGDGQLVSAQQTHNEYLQLAAEEGVVAPALVVAGLAVVAWALAGRVRRRGRGYALDWLAAGALAGLAALSVHSTFDFVWHVPVVPIVVAALVGAALHRGPSGAQYCRGRTAGRTAHDASNRNGSGRGRARGRDGRGRRLRRRKRGQRPQRPEQHPDQHQHEQPRPGGRRGRDPLRQHAAADRAGAAADRLGQEPASGSGADQEDDQAAAAVAAAVHLTL